MRTEETTPFSRQSTAAGAVASGGALPLSRTVRRFDPLSVTLAWEAAAGGGSFEAPLVRGSPYLTAVYSGLQPRVRFMASSIAGVSGGAGSARIWKGDPFTFMPAQQMWHVLRPCITGVSESA